MSDVRTVFEHEIELTNYVDAGLTVEGLWRGLEDFVRRPHEFVESMSASVVHEVSTDDGLCFDRELDFGNFKVHDAVRMHPTHSVSTHVPAAGDISESRFDIVVVQDGGELKLRFSYAEPHLAGVSDNPKLQGLRERAWLMKDRDVVRTILTRLLGK